MIINRLSLYNFGVYAGINVFEFNSNKPIILIGGLNGRGKTTFLEAILLALYGKNSFAYSENKGQTYGQYLRSYVNASDGTNEDTITINVDPLTITKINDTNTITDLTPITLQLNTTRDL